MSSHHLTIQPLTHIGGRGSIPIIFEATCDCGWRYAPNAPKWVFLAIQDHWIEAGLTNGRGLLPPADMIPIPEHSE